VPSLRPVAGESESMNGDIFAEAKALASNPSFAEQQLRRLGISEHEIKLYLEHLKELNNG
jgi:hypothetical protein